MDSYDHEDMAGPSHTDFLVTTDRTPLLQASQGRMGVKDIGISQQTLVSNLEYETKGQKLPQYVAAVSVTLGALAFGAVVGWSTSAGNDGVNLASEYNIEIDSSQFSWIGSISNLGAAAICIPIGLLVDIIGRKPSMLMLVVPFTIGWALLIWANSVTMFYIGRFLTGLSGGAFCVVAPMYTAEIAEDEIRGTLGTYFQLFLCIGIMFTYTLGAFASMFILSLVSAVLPLIFFVVFFFMPETPIYFLMKNKDDLARASLRRLRGPRYNVEQELQAKKETLAEQERNKGSFLNDLKTKPVLKGMLIAFGLMTFQQLSGVNAIIFYTRTIFGDSGGISVEISTIIVGGMQVGAVFVSTLVVDKVGRKILLISSEIAMSIATVALGVYFYVPHIGIDVSAFTWLPLVSVSVFLIMFNLGFGPIPWMMVGELFTPQVKGTAGSSACLYNWVMAFIVTRFYSDLVNAFGNYTTYWIFGVICALGLLFVIFIVPETKGKSLEQIQVELGANPRPNTDAEKA